MTLSASERRLRDRRIYDMHLAGRSFQEISDALRVDKGVIRRAVARMDQQAEQELGGNSSALRARQARQWRRIYHEAMEAWEHSKHEETTKVSTEAGASADKRKAEKTTKRQAGDPRFLNIAGGALAAERTMWDESHGGDERTKVIEQPDWYRLPAPREEEPAEPGS